MSLHLYSRVLVSLFMMASAAHAATANPPNAPGKPVAELPNPPAPPNQPNPPVQNPFEGVGRIDQVTRQTGGEIYRLDLSKALPLIRLEANPRWVA